MKKRVFRKLIVLLMAFVSAFSLSGCVKRDEEVYLLRDIANKYQIIYTGEDSEKIVTDDIKLETYSKGATITWKSSHPNIIEVPSGKVTTPKDDTVVTLTAEYFYKGEKEDYIVKREYKLNVLSKEEINKNNFSIARRKVIELSASKSEEDYLAATTVIEKLIVPTGEDPKYQTDYNKLISDYNNAKDMYLLDQAAKELRINKTQENYDLVVGLLENQSETVKQSYQRTLASELKHITFKNLFQTAVDSKLEADYQTALDYFNNNRNDFTTWTITYEKDLGNLKNYVNAVTRLSTKVYTPARLRQMISWIPSLDFLSEADLTTLKTNLMAALNQDVLDDEKKTNHFNATVATVNAYKLEYTAENEVLSEFLTAVYNLDDVNELRAIYKVSTLIYQPSKDNYEAAVAANNINSNAALKVEYNGYLKEFKNYYDVDEIVKDIKGLILDNVVTEEIIVQVYDDVLALEELLIIAYEINPDAPSILDAFVSKNVESIVASNLIDELKAEIASINLLFIVEEDINDIKNYINDAVIDQEFQSISNRLATDYPIEYQKVLADIKKVAITFPIGSSKENVKEAPKAEDQVEGEVYTLGLPTVGESGTSIRWKSSYEDLINSSGVIKQIDQKNQRSKAEHFSIVELTATVSSSKYPQRFSASVTIPVIVFAKDAETDDPGRDVDLSIRYNITKYSDKEINKFSQQDIQSEYGKTLVQKIQKTRQSVNQLASLETTKLIDYYQVKYQQTVFDSANVYHDMIEGNLDEISKGTLSQMINENTEQSMRVSLQQYQKELLDIKYNKPRSSKLFGKYALIFLLIVLFLLSQGLTVAYASKKGYDGFVYKLIATIPIGGLIYFKRATPRRNISKHGLRQVFTPKEILMKIVIYLEIILVAIIVIVPIVYIFGMALSGLRTDIPNQIWPDEPNLRGLTTLIYQTDFLKWYGNTFWIALINMVVGTVLITGASYVFSRFSFKGKKAGLLTLLALQSFPTFMSLLATYVLFWRFNLLGRPTALSIIYIGGSIPGNLWLVKGFLDQVPKDLDESANIDGANKLQIFFRIILPLAVPILTFVAVSMFMSPWMDYMLPGYLLNQRPVGAGSDYDVQQNWTLAVGLFDFINNTDNLNYSAFAFGALFVGLPITVIYMAFQKYLIEGIMAGATKG